ncbi:hypothetical protein KFE25_013220 [Diacronema lutheri]|uniref:Dynamin N-terminal domain-containing protein n=2 Tax=Diacronema lutheri TaxID=2081491 RepID=A0A8J5X8B4_DIALT|nr:hypothetical protein KFE25_013220 [Diacronema lutheri]
MFKNPFDVYAKYTKKKNELCALVAEARKLLQQLHAESHRAGRAPGAAAWAWTLSADMPTDHQLKELMERLVNDRIQVIVMGETKNGKSTFINALLGAEVLPSANIPCTSIVCSVQYADTKYALVTRRDRQDVGAKELIDLKYTRTRGNGGNGGSGGWGWGIGGSGAGAGGGGAPARAPIGAGSGWAATPAGSYADGYTGGYTGGYSAEGGLMMMAAASSSAAAGGGGAHARNGHANGACAPGARVATAGGAAVGAGDAAGTPGPSERAPRPGDALRPYVMTERALRDVQSPYVAVEVFWPLPLLKHQVVLIDTPGLNERASMDLLVKNYLPKADAVIFLLNGTKAITDVEARAIAEVRSRLGHEHMFIVVNKTDQVEPSELEATKRWVYETAAEMLPDVTAAEDRVLKGVPNRQLFVHFVSSTDALRAAERGDEPPKPFKALHENISAYLNAERFKPKLLSGSAALLHALRTVVAQLEAQLGALRELRAHRAAHRERLSRMAALAAGKQAKLDGALSALTSQLRASVHGSLSAFLHALLPRVEEIGTSLDSSSFAPRRAHEFAREVLAELSRQLEAEFVLWAQRELLPLVQGAYDDVISVTRAQLAELVRELKLLDGLAFGGINGMRLGQASDAAKLIDNLDFHRSLSRAHTGVAVGGCTAIAGGGLLVKACVVGAGGVAGILSLSGVGGALLACMGGAMGAHHAHTLAHLQNSAAEIQLQAAIEMQTRLAYAIDDPSDEGLVPSLTEAALKPIDDAVRHIYGTLAMQLSSVEKAARSLEAERQVLDDSVGMLEATLGAWNKIIARTHALLDPATR